eukprot:s901_g19.t1
MVLKLVAPRKYDTNKDASLSFAEFKKLCTELATMQKGAVPAEDDLEDIFDEFDKDNSDQLRASALHRLKPLFCGFAMGENAGPGVTGDACPDNFLGVRSAALSEEQLKQLRQKHDTNQDVSLAREEFDAMAQEIATLMGHKLPPGSSMKEIFDQFDKDWRR